MFVEFLETGSVLKTQIGHIRVGNVRDPLAKTKNGVGFVGIGPHKTKNGKYNSLEYDKWSSMFDRVYNEKTMQKFPTYLGCEVDPQWHNFQEFAEWCQWQHGFGKRDSRSYWHLDKDILIKGNKAYSPETCCFVPQEINTVLIRSDSARGDLPIGVCKYKHDGYIAKGSEATVGYLGIYPTVDSAFQAYKKAKESLISSIAHKYQKELDPRVFHALLNYQVEITD